MSAQQDAGGQSAAFLEAMNAYRVARATGDAEATAEAERALREVTRSELEEYERSQGRPGIPHRDIHARRR